MVIELTIAIDLEEDDSDPEQVQNPTAITELLSEMEDLANMKDYTIHDTRWEIL